ncbi:DM13 domain-containing protein [Shewanella donghaensis]|uniref:DM13 domain-containing protein n=1 Tax=Shewanella donghaensis TaxID=238836 RepID=UPI001181D1C9|nr:DM13 domain-containing protein [Shewanella donghaensis]
MKKSVVLSLIGSHSLVLAIGFAAGIYYLPILTAPKSPETASIQTLAKQHLFETTFSTERQDSDLLHWGEGQVFISQNDISFIGNLSPGPDFKLYLSKTFIETEADFKREKTNLLQVGDINTFENFIVPITDDVKVAEFNTVIVWCESFGQFITSARYQ